MLQGKVSLEERKEVFRQEEELEKGVEMPKSSVLFRGGGGYAKR